jgi:hypothetical protein
VLLLMAALRLLRALPTEPAARLLLRVLTMADWVPMQMNPESWGSPATIRLHRSRGAQA